jgi:hypothetical protein
MINTGQIAARDLTGNSRKTTILHNGIDTDNCCQKDDNQKSSGHLGCYRSIIKHKLPPEAISSERI